MRSENDVPQVLVVGAGIAGLLAAAAIRELGWEVSLVEQRLGFDGIGTGLFVPANGIRALAALGVLGRIARRGRRIDRLRIRGPGSAGGPAAVAALGKVWPAVGPSIAIHRSLLRDALLEAARVPVRTGVRLTSISSDANETCAVFADGSSARYDLVVGADGAGSAVRGQLWTVRSAGYGGESYWRGVVACPSGLDDWTLTLCHAGNLVAIPLADGRAYWAAGVSRQAPFRDEPPGRAARVRDLFADATGVAAAIRDALRRFADRRLPRVRHVQETTAMRNQLAALPLEQRLGIVPHWEEISVASFAPLVCDP